VDRLEVGDLISIRPGDVVPADGEIEDGHLSIDESVLSGESLPVSRDRGMAVFAGGTNRSGSATVRVTVTGASTNLAEIGRLLEKARADRPPIARLADRIASRFVIGVLLVATVTGIVWLGIDSTRVFEIVLATLVVTCPCALALATPAALAAAATHLANRGFLLVRSRILEVLRAGTTIVFDKTGTLTRGRPVVVETRLQSGQFERDYCLALAAAMEAASEHVLARAFEARQGNIEFDLRDVQPIPGKGVAASLDSVRYRIGSRPFVQELTGQGGGDNDEDVRTIVCLGSETGPLAEFVIGDELRSDAAEAITELNALGFRTAILSGDRRAAVATVARALQIDDWEAEMSPGEKLDRVAQRKAAGERVVMVGDGINDAPVLAAADASIALDAGTALARASADAIALSRRLMTVVEAALVAQRTRTIIRQNIAWAITYNVVAVPLAAAGVLSPWMAALGMSLSSLIVVLNALRLHRPGRGEKPTTSRDRAIVEASGSATT
jgi:Cu2+-exporting ATPase